MAVAASLIRDRKPDIVTLNEVCRDDVSRLDQTMSDTYRTTIASAFEPAEDRTAGAPYRCRNGQQYGIGVLALIPSGGSGYQVHGGVYRVQDLTDPEERVWVCIHAVDRFYACTTHTASTSRTLALAQCRDLLASALPAMRERDGDDPLIIGADLNLSAGRSPGPQSCLPNGYQRVDDGSDQDIIATPDVAIQSRAIIDMHATTDHPGLSADIIPRRPLSPRSDHGKDVIPLG